MDKYKIGFFGGCFNPPTIAHIELAKKAMNKVKLDKIIFVPMGDCYPKTDLISFKYRYEMLKIAIENEENMEVSDIQFNQQSKAYAIDTFRQIDKIYNCEKYFIMGTDNFSKIENWKDYEELKKYNFIVLERKEKLTDNEKIIFIDAEKYNETSSKQIREKIRNKEKNIEYLNKNILKYIQKNNLYN